MKKLKLNYKKIAYGFVSLAMVAVLIGCSVDWSNTPMIFATGSSSVYPLMKEFSNAYTKADLTIASGGSSNGVSKASEGLTDLGDASRSPKVSEAGGPLDSSGLPIVSGVKPNPNWQKNSLKTITIGWDGMAIVYKPTDPSYELVIDDENIVDIYTAFAGEKNVYWDELKNAALNPNATSEMNLGEFPSSTSHIPIKPFARQGAAMVSGTAEAFLKSNGFNAATQKKIQEVDGGRTELILEGKLNYGKNTIEVAESNSQAWNQFEAASDAGSMMYISVGFLKNNYDLLKDKGFKIAKYQSDDAGGPYAPVSPFDKQGDKFIMNVASNSSHYDWYRPFNTIVSTNANRYVKDFIWWMMDYKFDPNNNQPLNKQGKILDDVGVIPLSNPQKSSMFKNNKIDIDNFWVNDYDLIKESYKSGSINRTGNAEDPGSLYGAIK